MHFRIQQATAAAARNGMKLRRERMGIWTEKVSRLRPTEQFQAEVADLATFLELTKANVVTVPYDMNPRKREIIGCTSDRRRKEG